MGLEHPEKFRQLYMISPYAFKAAACVYKWFEPMGTAVGLMPDENVTSNIVKDELVEAIESVISHMKETISFESKGNFMDIFLKEIGEKPDNLENLLRKAEEYQKKYTLDKDVMDIINMFELCLRDELIKNPNMSSLCTMLNGMTSLDKLVAVNEEILSSSVETWRSRSSGKIRKELGGVIDTSVFTEICLSNIIFIAISMALFLGMSNILNMPFDKVISSIAILCYIVSGFFDFVLRSRQYICISIKEGIRECCKKPSFETIYRVIMTIVLPVLTSSACFWVMLWLGNMWESLAQSIWGYTAGVITGKFLSLLLKEAYSWKN